MFKLNPAPTFKARVTIPVPGQAKPDPIEFEFKHKSQSQLKEWAEKSDARKSMTDAAFLMDFAVGWSGVDGEFNEENLKAFCDNYHGAALVVWDAYLKELTAARLGNSGQ